MDKRTNFKNYMKTLFLKYTILTILLLFILYIISIYFAFQFIVVRENKQQNQELVELVTKEFAEFSEGLRVLVDDPVIKRATIDKRTIWEANTLLYSFQNGQRLRANFAILDQNGDVISTSLYEDNKEELQSSYLSFDFSTNKREVEIVSEAINPSIFSGQQKSSYVFGKAIWDKSDFRGYVLFFLEELNKSVLSINSGWIVLTDRYDNVIFSSNHSLVNGIGKLELEHFTSHIASVDNQYLYLTESQSEFNQLKVLTMTSLGVFQHSIWIVIYTFIGILIMVVVLLYILLPKIMKRSLQSFDTLIDFIRGTDRVSKIQPFEEFQAIQDEFDDKVRQIQELIQVNASIAETKRKMEIKNLETQFNPHFAFNVLETIRYELLFDPENASNMLVSFANLLRYNINYGNTIVPFKKDITYVEDYLMLQKMRYNKRLDYHLFVGPNIEDMGVPKLIIQPIIENSIKHCIEHTRHLQLEIRIVKEQDHIHMAVADNGQGIPSARLAQINDMLKDKTQSPEHIGLYHVHRMVQLLYGDPYGLKIDSLLGRGTKVEITIPFEGERNDV